MPTPLVFSPKPRRSSRKFRVLQKPLRIAAMGAIKRKADQADRPSKKEKGTPNCRSAKRQRKSDVAAEHTTPKPKPERAAQRSIFKDEEKVFPRGGASVLTPLEHKQIQIKANQDVLFEQAGLKRSGADALSDQGSDAGAEDASKASKKRKSKKAKTVHTEEEKKHKIRADGLTFKVRFWDCARVADLTSSRNWRLEH